jgi:enoyl-CoA hydratase/carnithine racemase
MLLLLTKRSLLRRNYYVRKGARTRPLWTPEQPRESSFKQLEKKDASLLRQSKWPGHKHIRDEPGVYMYARDPLEDMEGHHESNLLMDTHVPGRQLFMNRASTLNALDSKFSRELGDVVYKWTKSSHKAVQCVFLMAKEPVRYRSPMLQRCEYNVDPVDALSQQRLANVERERRHAAQFGGEKGRRVENEVGENVFCAGVDMLALYEARRRQVSDADSVLRAQAKLVATVANARKPLVSVVNGLAVGVGGSMAALSNLCAVDRSSVYALPDTAMGLSPVGGASQYLNRLTLPGFGMMLALTGKRVRGHDLIHCGVATTALSDTDVPLMCTTIRDGGVKSLRLLFDVLDEFEAPAIEPYLLQPYTELIERCFGQKDSVEDICAALAAEPLHFAGYLLQKMLDNSPIALKATHRLLREAEQREIEIDASIRDSAPFPEWLSGVAMPGSASSISLDDIFGELAALQDEASAQLLAASAPPPSSSQPPANAAPPKAAAKVRSAWQGDDGAHLLGFEQALRDEFRVASRLAQLPDFESAVHARIKSRGTALPQWSAQSLADVSSFELNELFAPFDDPADELQPQNPFKFPGANYRPHLQQRMHHRLLNRYLASKLCDPRQSLHIGQDMFDNLDVFNERDEPAPIDPSERGQRRTQNDGGFDEIDPSFEGFGDTEIDERQFYR